MSFAESTLRITVDSSGAINNVRNLEQRLERTQAVGLGVTSAMGAMKTAIGLAAAAAGGLTFTRIIRDTANFEETMLGLKAVSGATEAQMMSLQEQARTLGATTRYTAQQAGEAQRFLAQAGFEVNEVLSATPGILNLATAGQLDLARAADIASNVLGQFVLPVSDLGRVSDVLAASAAGSNTNIDQMAQALAQAGPIANSAGVSIEEAAAAIGVLSDAGIQGGRAGTGLLGVIRQLSNVTPQAEKVLAKYGLSVADVNVQTNGLNNVLAKLAPLASNTADSFAVFQSEAGPAAQVLANGADRARDFTEELNHAAGAADAMSAIIGSGLANSTRTFNSGVSESILQVGEGGLGGSFEYLLDNASAVLAIYNDMLPAFAEANDLTDEQIQRAQSLAKALQYVGDAALAVAGIYGARMVSALGASAAGIAQSIYVNNAHSVAIAENTAREAERQAAIYRTVAAEKTAAANSAALSAQRTTSARMEAAADAQRLASWQASIAAERALETQRLQSQISATGRAQSLARLAELRTAETATINQQTAANVRLTEAEVAETSAARTATTAKIQQAEANTAATAAMGRYTAAAGSATAASGVMATATRAGAGALALVGGPAGAAVLAAAGLYYFREELGLTDGKMRGTIDTIKDTGDAFVTELSDMWSQGQSIFSNIQSGLTDIDAGFIDMKASAAESFAGIVGGSADAINLGLIPIQKALNTLDETFAGLINRTANAFESAGAMPFGMDNLFGEQVSRLRGMADEITDNLIAPIGISTEALENNAKAWREQAEAMRNGVSTPSGAGSLNSSVVDMVTGWFGDGAGNGEGGGGGNGSSDTKKLDSELKQASDSFNALTASLSPSGKAMADYNANVADLQLLLKHGKISQLEYTAAIAGAATEYNKAAYAADDYNKSLELRRQLQQQLDTDASSNALDVLGIGMGDQQIERMRSVYEIQQQYQQKQQQLLSQYNSGDISRQQYDDQYKIIEEFSMKAVAQQQRMYDAIDMAQGEWQNGSRAAYQDYIADVRDVAGQTQSIFADGFKGAEDALVNFVKTGKIQFSDLINSIAEDLIRLQVRQSITGPLSSALSSAFGSGGVPGGISGPGGYSTSGGDFIGSIGFAAGGYTGAGGKYDVKGPVHAEEFVVRREVVKQPGVRPMLERLNKGYADGGYAGSGSSPMASQAGDVNIIIHNEGQPAQVSKTENRIGANGQREVHMWMKTAFESGAMDGTMRNRFGVKRRPGGG